MPTEEQIASFNFAAHDGEVHVYPAQNYHWEGMCTDYNSHSIGKTVKGRVFHDFDDAESERMLVIQAHHSPTWDDWCLYQHNEDGTDQLIMEEPILVVEARG